jgi:hypothetical protein
MAVRYYSSLDTGAPILPSVSNQRFIDNLKLILKACLVDGYAENPAAGWTVGHDHADGFSLSNGGGIINFVHETSQAVAVYLMETITDGATALASGYNRRSGPWFDGQGTAQRHFHYAPSLMGTTATKQWCLVADEQTATLLWYGGNTLIDNTSTNGGALHFGAYRPSFGESGFCALGGGTSATIRPQVFGTSGLSGASLRNPFTGAVDQGPAPLFAGSAPKDWERTSVNNKPAAGVTLLRPVRASLQGVGTGISGSTTQNIPVFCGLLRGLIVDPALAEVYLSNVLPLFGVTSPTYTSKIVPFTLPSGQQWVPLYAHTSDLGGFISLDPADWE